MSTAYQHLVLAELQPGMILSESLLDQNGQLLLPQGAVLTASTIDLLPRHGIHTVPVVRAGGGAAVVPPPDPDAVRARLGYLFRKNGIENHDDWATGILHRYIEDYRLDRGIEE